MTTTSPLCYADRPKRFSFPHFIIAPENILKYQAYHIQAETVEDATVWMQANCNPAGNYVVKPY